MSAEADIDHGHVDEHDAAAAAHRTTMLHDKLVATGRSWGVRILAVLIGLALW